MTHGYPAYTRGCRCELCRAAKRDYIRHRRRTGKEVDLRRSHDPASRHYSSRPIGDSELKVVTVVVCKCGAHQ